MDDDIAAILLTLPTSILQRLYDAACACADGDLDEASRLIDEAIFLRDFYADDEVVFHA